jgi:hypothetical protein
MMALDWFLPKKERGAINGWNNNMKESFQIADQDASSKCA